MAGESPDVVLYDVNGNMLAVQNGSAIPASTPALLLAGSDGTNSRYITIDSSGRPVVVGAGTAGSPAGGVVSIQGVASGTAVPISGTVSISGTVGVTQSTSPWVDNITQFGGTNISTGTGAGGAGIPRVTVSNDSNILATQSGTWTVTATQTTASNLLAEVGGLGAANSAPVGNPLYLGVVNPAGNLVSLIGDTLGAAGVAIMSNEFAVLSNTTIIANGSQTITKNNYGTQEINLIVNVTGSVTGTTPTLQFTITELDPGNNTTTFGNSSTTTVINAGGVFTATLNSTTSSSVKVSWTVGGTSPSFGGVYATVVTKATPVTQPVSQSGTWTVQQGTPPWSVSQSGTWNVGLNAGSNNIGSVNQGTSPWVDNITQFGGTNISTGTGAGGAGIPRVTVSNDSNILATQSGTWTVAQGAPNSNANKWPVQVTDGTHNMPTMDAIARAGFQEITDGTNGPVAVKAASTAAVAADPSLVTAFSPNSPLPTGTNTIGALTANQSVNVAQIAGSTTSTAATGVQKVGIVGNTGTAFESTAGILDHNLRNVANNAVATAATGVQKVGIVGSTGTALDGTTAGVLDDNIRNIGGNAVSTAGSGVIKVGIVGSATSPLDAAIGVGTAPVNGLGVLAQYNTSLPAPTNAQTMSLQSDQAGNLLEFPGVQFKTGAAWTSSTTINTLQYTTGTSTPGAPTGATAVIVQLDQTTTITGGAVTFQGTYDGTNWVTIPTAQVLNPQTYAQLTNPYTFVASTNQPFLIMLQGFQQVRANLTTLITGTGSVTPNWTVVAASPISTVAIANGFNKVQGMGPDGSTATGNPDLIAGLDQSGNARIPRVDSTFRQMAVVETPIAAAMGIIGTNPIAETTFGYVATSAKTQVPVRATTYTQISGAPVQVSVKSASANDSSAGTGTRTITITYLTTGLVRKTEVITMNGTTAVNSVNTDYAFIEKVISSTAGSGRTNAGIITVFQGAGGTGTALCSIAAADGRTNLCHHYVTTGKTCYITQIQVSNTAATNATIQFQLTNNAETDILIPIMPGFRTITQQAVYTVNFNPPIKVPDSSITNGNLIIPYITPDATTAATWFLSFTYFEV